VRPVAAPAPGAITTAGLAVVIVIETEVKLPDSQVVARARAATTTGGGADEDDRRRP
jgi:hypothetical protein